MRFTGFDEMPLGRWQFFRGPFTSGQDLMNPLLLARLLLPSKSIFDRLRQTAF